MHESSAGLLSALDAESFHNGLPSYFYHILTLFEGAKAYSQSATFAQLALQTLGRRPGETEALMRQDLLARLFMAAIKTFRHRDAFMALSRYTDTTLQKSAMATLVRALFAPSEQYSNPDQGLNLLQSMPLGAHPSLASVVDETLHDLYQKEAQASHGSPSTTLERAIGVLNIQHAYRLHQKDYRGAVEVLLDQMKLVEQLLESRPDDDSIDIRHTLLAIVNCLSCAPPDEAFILRSTEKQATPNHELQDGQESQSSPSESVILTLRELRQSYQLYLDSYARVVRGDFDFAVDEEDY